MALDTYCHIPWYFGNNGDTVCSSIQQHYLAALLITLLAFGESKSVVFYGDGTGCIPYRHAAGPDDMLYIMDSNIPAVLMVDPLTGDRT